MVNFNYETNFNRDLSLISQEFWDLKRYELIAIIFYQKKITRINFGFEIAKLHPFRNFWFQSLKGLLSVILSDPPFKGDNAWCTAVPFKP